MFKVVIPAAGEGRRLRPHTHIRPKVLLEVAGKPILGHIMDRVVAADPQEVCIVTGYRGGMVSDYVEDAYKCRLQFVTQDEPRGLGDAVFRAREHFDGEPILVLLGDTIVDVDIAGFTSGGNVIGVREVEDPRRFGVVELDGERVRRLVEKPADPPSNLAIVGVYYFTDSTPLFDALERLIEGDRRTRGEYQLTDALQMMIESGVDIRTRRIEHWLDCGTADALLDTNRYLLVESHHAKPRAGAVLVPPLFVHDSARIENSVVGPNVSVGPEVVIRDSVVTDSIVNRAAVVEQSLLERSILGEGCVVKDRPRRLNVGVLAEFTQS
jgi:glucose-1-phosphate thymidylyltransferase